MQPSDTWLGGKGVGTRWNRAGVALGLGAREAVTLLQSEEQAAG